MKRSEAQIRVQQFLDAHEKMASHGPDCIVALHIDNNNSVLRSSDLIALIKELEDAKINARRYQFLSGRIRKMPKMLSSPYIVNPNKSRLYAVATYTPDHLDAAIDLDMLEDMSNFVYRQKLAEGDIRFIDPGFQFSDEFAKECEDEARKILSNQF